MPQNGAAHIPARSAPTLTKRSCSAAVRAAEHERGNLDPAMGRDRRPTSEAAWTRRPHANARERAGNPSEIHWMLSWPHRMEQHDPSVRMLTVVGPLGRRQQQPCSRATGTPQHFPGRFAHARRGELRVRCGCAGGLAGPAQGAGDTRGIPRRDLRADARGGCDVVRPAARVRHRHRLPELS
jgi:hypothetical protein